MVRLLNPTNESQTADLDDTERTLTGDTLARDAQASRFTP